MLTRKKRKRLENGGNSDTDPHLQMIKDILTPEELKKFDPNILDKLKNVIVTMSDREPNIVNIINSNIDINHKTNLVELCEVYRNTDPCSEDALRLKQLVNRRFVEYKTEAQDLSELPPHLRVKYLESRQPDKSNLLLKILMLKTSNDNIQTLVRKYQELRNSSTSDEYSKLKKWINYALELPYDKLCKTPKLGINILSRVSSYLDLHIYGLKNIKEQLLLFLSSKLQNTGAKGCSIGLLGPPGVGKTVLAKCLSRCLEFPFEQVSFGGITNPEFLTGHDYTYIGSRPGEIVRCLSRMKSKNGIMFFDEFDKIGSKKDICSTLLHITDPSQNNTFRDNYLADITVDLSNIWFIYSMNTHPSDSALRDRIFIIEIDGYSNVEKIEILKKHLFPNALESLRLTPGDIIFSDQVIKHIVTHTQKYEDNKGGVRYLERIIRDICRKINLLVKMKGGLDLSFKVDSIKNFPVIVDDIKIIDKLINSQKSDDQWNPLNMLYI
jgi:ATP-dependent Lon protease